MRDKEIQLFSDGMNSAKDELYFDAIASMNELIIQFPDSELVDDAIYNIGLCYFNLNHFDNAITYFSKCIDEFPDGTISVLTGGNEYGRTAAKCYYAVMNCYLALGKINDAKIALNKLANYPDSYVQLENDEKITYEKLASKAFQLFTNQIIK
jgi:tetratricopeptide (TPR) repeat protein